MAGSCMTKWLWPTDSVAVTPEQQDLGSNDQLAFFFPPLLTTANQPQKTKYAYKLNKSDVLLLLSSPPSYTTPTTANQSNFQTFFCYKDFLLSCLPWSLCPKKTHGSWLALGSSEWAASVLIWVVFMHFHKLKSWILEHSLPQLQKPCIWKTKIEIFLHNLKASGKWELGSVGIGTSRFLTGHYH